MKAFVVSDMNAMFRADTLYLCYCIDKASGVKRREEVFIVFEYDSSPTSIPAGLQSRPTAPVPSSRRKNQETLFDAESEEEGIHRIAHSRPLPTPQQTQRGQRTTPLSAYLDEEMSTTPTAKGKGRKEPVMPVKIPEEEEDLDPFRRSIVDDEEAQIKMATRVNPVGMRTPGIAGTGLGQAGRPSGGVAPKRMLTSTQELNMKSQFLMNMRPYGVEESQSSETVEMSGTREDEESLSDGEESQLGPGSDFFK